MRSRKRETRLIDFPPLSAKLFFLTPLNFVTNSAKCCHLHSRSSFPLHTKLAIHSTHNLMPKKLVVFDIPRSPASCLPRISGPAARSTEVGTPSSARTCGAKSGSSISPAELQKAARNAHFICGLQIDLLTDASLLLDAHLQPVSRTLLSLGPVPGKGTEGQASCADVLRW